MSRRHHEPDDSLELLLDPICNMFGTIMFVALIAALLALTRSGVVVSDAVSAMEREQASAVSQMEGRATELERTLSTLPAGEGRELDQAAADRVERALGEVARREVLIERYQDTVKTARENMDDVASQVEPMRTELMRVRDAVEAARRSKDRQVRTPLEREVSLFEFTVVVWNDQLFAICDLTTRPRDACEWLRCWNQKHVVPARCTTPVFECSRVNIHIARSIMLREGARDSRKRALAAAQLVRRRVRREQRHVAFGDPRGLRLRIWCRGYGGGRCGGGRGGRAHCGGAPQGGFIARSGRGARVAKGPVV